MNNKKEGNTKKQKRKSAIFAVTSQLAAFIFTIIVIILAVIYVVLPNIVPNIFEDKYSEVVIVSALLTIICLIMIWTSTNKIVKDIIKEYDVIFKEGNQAVVQKVDEYSLECVSGLVANQKRVFGPYLDDINHVSQSDIRKALDFLGVIKQYDSEGMLTDEEIKKVQVLLKSLQCKEENWELCSYANMKDLKWLEQNVEENGRISVISQNVTDNEELNNIIINNLKKGIKYNYYLYREAGIEELKEDFSKNLKKWEENVGRETVENQVKCWIVPPEFVQMVIIIYNAQNLEKPDAEYKAGVVVKLPAEVKKDFPLFFYVTGHRDLLIHFKKILEYLRQNSEEYWR